MKIVAGGVFSTILICAFIRLTNSHVTSLNREIRQAGSGCGSLQFRCSNGDCIGSHLLCDGRGDCKDRSDETREECTRAEIVCPDVAFRCDYGACVDGDAPCNGIDDCIDRSDEQLPRCHNIASNNNSTDIGPCAPGNFKCNNDKCIAGTAVCDGRADCTDRSDETSELCNRVNCPVFTFRCAYGACIEQSLKCDGFSNCADGSDEDPKLCGTSSTQSPTVPLPKPSHQPPSRTRPPCGIPAQPKHGRWQLHKSQCTSGQHCDPPNVTDFDPGTYLIYSCNAGYKVQDQPNVFCGPGGEWSSTPSCVEIRCKALSSPSTDASCTYNDEWTSCEVPVPPKTKAKVSCRNSYRQDLTMLSSRRDTVRCNERGRWEPEPIRCSPVCGRTRPSDTTPLIYNGQRPNITEFPWHATLYRSETPDGEKQFICGATIIQSDLLITAAHCVYDEVTKTVEDPRKFAVATGNTFRDFNSPYHQPSIVKKAYVKNIYVICNYLGLEGNYASDIAILHLKQPFVFSSILMPACLDVGAFSDNSVLDPGNFGKVAGFGRTAKESSSQVLQTIAVPYVSFNECKASTSDSDTEKFITLDKFCAGYRNGSSVCDGDSGGGFVFKTSGLWYLRGLVSVGIGATYSGGIRSCDSHAYSLYTRISNHIEWIQDVILKLEIYGKFPACPGTPSRDTSQ